jgi:hypothetical protein
MVGHAYAMFRGTPEAFPDQAAVPVHGLIRQSSSAVA